MAQLVVAAAGAAIGYATFGVGAVAFGLTGAQLGWMAGSMLGSAFAPTQKSQGPRLDDLKVATSSYGTPIPYIAGHPRVAGQIVWASAKREIATTESAGKGGGGSEYTTYTYEVDLLYLLSDNEIAGVSRVWNNGELIFNGTLSNNAWSRLTAYTGASSQMPDPTYEAAVGTANAPAYRGRGSVFIESLQLGGNGQIPNLTFEIGVTVDIGTDTLFVLHGNDLTDASSYAISPTTAGSGASVITVEAVSDAAGGWQLNFKSGSIPNYLLFEKPTGFLSSTTASFTLECFVDLTSTVSDGYADGRSSFIRCLSAGSKQVEFSAAGSASSFVLAVPGAYSLYPSSGSNLTRTHLAVVRDSGTTYLLIDGVLANKIGASNFNIDQIYVGNTALTSRTCGGYLDEVRFSAGKVWDNLTSANVPGNVIFTPATTQLPDSGAVYTYATQDATLQDTATALCERTGLQASQFDTTALSTITRPVRAMAISQVASARTVLEMLSAAYHFDCVLSDKLYFRPRASASAATLTFDEFGVAVDGSNINDPLPLMMANELEIPAQMAITFSNVDGDYQTDTQYSDRLLTGQESTSATTLPLGFTASEGKQIADALLLDKAVSALTTTVSLNITRAKLEPTDVVVLTGDDSSTYRMRIVGKKEASGVITLACVADDATVFTQAGVTAGGTASQTTVAATPATDFELLDIPLLRDADNLPGFYVAVEGGAANWTHCAIYSSLDDLTYSLVTTMADQTAVGACTTTLGNWTGGNVFDETNTVTVYVGAIPQLVSVTRDDILTNTATNAALIGSELIQYRTATLVSAGVYTLSGLLRGRRGTEWAMTGHGASELFVSLGLSGLRYIALQSGDLGSARYYKAVSAGQRLSAVTAQSITPAGVSLECFSPVNARADRTTTDTVITWTRRTRLSTRLTGALPISAPLGETTESYEIEVWDSGYTTLKRTLTASSETVTYTSAQQVTDFGSNQATLYLKIYQLSATVGRGYPLTGSV